MMTYETNGQVGEGQVLLPATSLPGESPAPGQIHVQDGNGIDDGINAVAVAAAQRDLVDHLCHIVARTWIQSHAEKNGEPLLPDRPVMTQRLPLSGPAM